MRERNTARMGGCERSEKVEDVHFAGQTRREAGGAGGSLELNCRASGRERVAGGAPFACADSISANFSAGGASDRGEFFSALIVRIDHCDPRRRINRSIEEQTLGGEI